MEEGVGPPPRADCDRSWVKMEGTQNSIGEGIGPPPGSAVTNRADIGRLGLPSWSAVTSRGPPLGPH